jgi:hypothetical protein
MNKHKLFPACPFCINLGITQSTITAANDTYGTCYKHGHIILDWYEEEKPELTVIQGDNDGN